MKRKLYISIFLFTFIMLTIFTAILGVVSFKVYESQLNNKLRTVAGIIKIDKNSGLSFEVISYKYSNIGNISIIDQEGTLITSIDSGIDKKESLLSRQEIKEALKTGEGSSIRFNDESRDYYLYKAFRISEDILLIAVPLAIFSDVVQNIIFALLVIMVLTVIVGTILSRYFYKTIIRPVDILEAYVRKKAEDDSISEVEIQNLPYELKAIVKTFKKNQYKLGKVARKEQDKKLYLLTTINSMEDGFIALDENNVIKLINKSALKILNIDEEVNFEDNILMVTQNMDLFTALNGSTISFRNQEITIEDRIYELSIIPLSEDKGKLVLLNDITDLNKIEVLRKKFVANMTHELKTPLTLIKGFIETLKKDGLNNKETVDKFLGIIEEESFRLERLIDDILILSNIENMTEIKREKVEVKKETEKVFTLFKEAARNKDVALKQEIEENMTLNFNKDLFEVMLSNLINNGIKYGMAGGEVKVKGYLKNNKAFIEVIDYGIGIPVEDQERIFERFYKVDKSRSLDHESTGLGLSIVKHIVKSFGGVVKLESKIDEGSRFIVEIPIEGRKENE